MEFRRGPGAGSRHLPNLDHPWIRDEDKSFRKQVAKTVSAKDPRSAVKKLDQDIIKGDKGPMGARWALKHRPPMLRGDR